MERVKHDLLIQERRVRLERWKMDVEAEKKEEESRKKRVRLAVSEGATDVRRVDGIDSAAASAADDHHPILGPAVLDLGYKRVHLASARSLAAIPIWEKQRVYRHDRAKLMATDKARTKELGFPGIISLHEGVDGRLVILDGQHRVGMMAILQERSGARKAARKMSSSSAEDDPEAGGSDDDGGSRLDLDRVLVEVFPQPSSSSPSTHARDIFTEINKAEPVKLVDMPGIAKKSDRRTIDEAASKLVESSPAMFKPSQRCRPPHLNVDNLRDALFASDVLRRRDLRSARALLGWMEEKNRELKRRFKDGEGKDGGDGTMQLSKTALAKANKHNFYLGLDSSWLYQ